jgi:ABC-type transport system involved in multi-copper enzyme maturation permease subunit
MPGAPAAALRPRPRSRSRRGTARCGGFGQVLHAEWTKFRTVRGWVIGVIVAPLVTVGLGYLVSSGITCSQGPHPCSAPAGPGGESVTDSFYFVHQALRGNGSITVRVTSLTGTAGTASGGGAGGQGTAGLQPWSKAGILIKAGTTPGSAYAAMLVTAAHGVRMQYDFTGDTAGLPGAVSPASPRWLRLTRSGSTVTGYDSADGSHWIRAGTARLPGLPATVQGGLFAASPPPAHGGPTAVHAAGPAEATATFDHVGQRGIWPAAAWTGTTVGADSGAGQATGGFRRTGGTVTVSGSGDIAPAVGGLGGGMPLAETLTGAFAGLIALAVMAAMFVGAEYQRGLIAVTLAASPRRGQVLAAKAIVIGAVTFAAGLAGAAVAVLVGKRVLHAHGAFVAPASVLTQVRVVAGTAALLAVTAVLALALGSVLRRGADAVTAVIAGIVLPYLLAVATPLLPAAASDWLLRVTPAAAFAVQGTSVRYSQVSNDYLPFFGYYPLPPWTGFAVLCGYTALALALAAVLLRRRDV